MMQDVVKNIVKEITDHDYFNNFLSLKIYISDKSKTGGDSFDVGEYKYSPRSKFVWDDFERWLNSKEVIKSYNVTVQVGENGGVKWRTGDFIFWSGSEYPSNKLNTAKFGAFEYKHIGSSAYESFDHGGLSYKLSYLYGPYNEKKDRPFVYNRYKLDDFKTILNMLIELDKLIVKQKDEKELLFNELKQSPK